MPGCRLRMLVHQGFLVEVTHALSWSCFESADLIIDKEEWKATQGHGHDGHNSPCA